MNYRKIALVTATRAEYGLLAPVIRNLRKRENSNFIVEFIVCGTHLSPEYGMTIDEISADGLRIDHRINTPVESSSAFDISNNQAKVIMRFAEHFERIHYDAVILLGDRYELLSIAIAACNAKIPIFHLYGGDTSEGAIDEYIRHAITKMSYLHFVSNEVSKKRVIQLGETPERVFNYGSTSIDNITKMHLLSKRGILNELNIDDCNYAVGTYHPVTLTDDSIDECINDLIDAVCSFPDILFIMTGSNADKGGARINELLTEAEKNVDNLRFHTSLGTFRYLSLLKHAEFVIGNSSSGIIEAPAVYIPTVNIGDRQKGRLQSESIINCGSSSSEIVEAIKTVMSSGHKAICRNIVSPYGDGHAGERIADKIYETVTENNIELRKSFYDIK